MRTAMLATIVSLSATILLAAAPHRPGPTTRPTVGPGSSTAAWPHPNRIVSVTGMVQFRPIASAPWEKAAAGIDLPDGAQVRIGQRSAIRLRSGHKEITIDHLGRHDITRELYQPPQPAIKLGVGRKRFDFDEAGGEHTSDLITPSSVIGIRGDHPAIGAAQPATRPASAPATRHAGGTTPASSSERNTAK